MRGAPYVTLAAAIVRTNFRSSAETRGRPGPLLWDSLHQYTLNRRRCQFTTVAGCTMTRADFHFVHIFIRTTQNRRSRRCSVGRGRSRLRIADCCVRAAFSKATSLWPPKMRRMKRNILKTALSMTRYFAFTVAENQSHRLPYEFWRGTRDTERLRIRNVE